MAFSKDVEKFRKDFIKLEDDVYRASTLSLFTKVIVGTPVKKGVLRGAWYTNVGSPDTTSKNEATASDEPKRTQQRAVDNGGKSS